MLLQRTFDLRIANNDSFDQEMALHIRIFSTFHSFLRPSWLSQFPGNSNAEYNVHTNFSLRHDLCVWCLNAQFCVPSTSPGHDPLWKERMGSSAAVSLSILNGISDQNRRDICDTRHLNISWYFECIFFQCLYCLFIYELFFKIKDFSYSIARKISNEINFIIKFIIKMFSTD